MSALVNTLVALAPMVISTVTPRSGDIHDTPICDPLTAVATAVAKACRGFAPHRQRWPLYKRPASGGETKPYEMELVTEDRPEDRHPELDWPVVVDGYGPGPTEFMDQKRASYLFIGLVDTMLEIFGLSGDEQQALRQARLAVEHNLEVVAVMTS